ncbi:hypothetical protein ABBQ32_007268 [Trebouxia sp. C0010 RCD-2024]
MRLKSSVISQNGHNLHYMLNDDTTPLRCAVIPPPLLLGLTAPLVASATLPEAAIVKEIAGLYISCRLYRKPLQGVQSSNPMSPTSSKPGLLEAADPIQLGLAGPSLHCLWPARQLTKLQLPALVCGNRLVQAPLG